MVLYLNPLVALQFGKEPRMACRIPPQPRQIIIDWALPLVDYGERNRLLQNQYQVQKNLMLDFYGFQLYIPLYLPNASLC